MTSATPNIPLLDPPHATLIAVEPRNESVAALAPRTHDGSPAAPILLRVENLQARFPIKTGFLQRTTGWHTAVDSVTIEVARGETLGLVGESGCGKTTLGRTLLKLIPASGGRATFDGVDVFAARGEQLKSLRKRMQIVFQDPAGSLNPRMRIIDIIGEPLRVHALVSGTDHIRHRVETLLERCGMPKTAADRYPHEFSGGQRQRICIARALALEPSFIVCDEPTSALDVSIQAQILNLLKDLQRDLGLSYLFISHDMAVIQHMCDRIAVMKGGRIVETGSKQAVINAPRHAYTQTLLAAVPGAKVRPPMHTRAV